MVNFYYQFNERIQVELDEYNYFSLDKGEKIPYEMAAIGGSAKNIIEIHSSLKDNY